VSLDFDTLILSDLSRHFGRRRALSQVSFECRAGEIIGLLGPNGAGKSTLLSIVATLIAPSSGDIRYGSHRAADRDIGPQLRARIGLLGHDLYLYPELTARENLVFFARLYGLPDPNARVASALDAARLAERADDQVSGFSRGMRQRLALERALLHGPRLLLLDEPFTGLDDASASTLVGRLHAAREQGTIVVLATHDLDVADGLVNRAIVLRDGKVVAREDRAETIALRAWYREQAGARAS
jgi:ABC-type multidrug transport system ATPase subunit